MVQVLRKQVLQEPEELIAHILTRFHEMHRQELPVLIDLADTVETVHVHDEWAPRGLARFLRILLVAMDQHMNKEEMILFPAMQAGGVDGIQFPIQVMRGDHEAHLEDIAQIRALTNNLSLPHSECESWTSLYAGLQKFMDDLLEHIRLENDALFPMFEEVRD
ncbi:MAG: hemerythrin domain-containing protein [Parvibaculum sp.]